MKALQVIEGAYTELGILVAGKSLATDDLKWATTKFNSFLKTKSVDSLNIYAEVEESFPLVINQASYTIGTGGDFDTIRPNTIKAAFIRDVYNDDRYIRIRAIDEYWDIQTKTVASRPRWLFYKRDYPLGIIYLYYAPDSTEDLHIISYKALETYDDVKAEDIVVPGEYEEMFISNLALRIAPRYGRVPTRELKDTASETLDGIRGDNLAKNMIGNDFNYLTDRRRRRGYNIDNCGR